MGGNIREAQSSAATDLGAKVAEKIITSIAGEGAGKLMALIFGGDDNPLTLEQVEQAINSAFAKAAIKDVKGDRNGLMNQVRYYNPDPERDTNQTLDDVRDVLRDTGNIQGDITEQITKENSRTTIPLFISIWNVRLAFAAERYRLNKLDSEKEKIAGEAVFGLQNLEHYLSGYFYDTKRDDPCVAKDVSTQLPINGARGTNWTEKAIDISTWYCIGNGRVMKADVYDHILGHEIGSADDVNKIKALGLLRDAGVVNLNGAAYMKNTDIGRDGGLYLFARRMDNMGRKAFLEVSPSKQFAYMLRNHYFVKYYPRELGDLHSLILGWVDIAQATGTEMQIRQALMTAMDLGIGWDTLKHRYNNEAHEEYVRQHIGLFEYQGEKRKILDN
ncbi:MAG: hypothetical protein EP349_09520 [Alphaproteobacteria bacterium]|nr:MAG: hypothetical protein EP349_09520 [Alphaproteobacteria bacterium]